MMLSLDLKCAEAGQSLAQIKGINEKLLNAALAVLQEQGLYACFLYLRAQGKDPGKEVSQRLYEFLHEIPGLKEHLSKEDKKQDSILNPIAKLTEDLDKLLFARDLLLQVLTYARYHIKAESGGSS